MEGRTRFSAHAEQQLRERGIDRQLVEETVGDPEQLITISRNRKIAQRVYRRLGKDFLLRVVFYEGPVAEMITAYWTSRISRYWRKE